MIKENIMIEIIIIIAVWWIFVLPIIEKIGRDRQEKRDLKKEQPRSEFQKAQMLRYERELKEADEAEKIQKFQEATKKRSQEQLKKDKMQDELYAWEHNGLKKKQMNKVANLDKYDTEVFDILYDLRTQIATAHNIPPYIVFSNKTLKELSVKLPQNKQEMLDVHGIGEVKFERYGEEFLEVLKKLSENAKKSEEEGHKSPDLKSFFMRKKGI